MCVCVCVCVCARVHGCVCVYPRPAHGVKLRWRDPRPAHGVKLRWRDKVRRDLKTFHIYENTWYTLAHDRHAELVAPTHQGSLTGAIATAA